MAEIEQDLIAKFIEEGSSVTMPPKLPPMKNVKKKRKLAVDLDGTAWDWTRHRSRGVENMNEETSLQLQKEADEVRKSFGRTFDAAGTFDHPAILENSDLVIHEMLSIANKSWVKDPILGQIDMLQSFAKLLAAVIKAYHKDREEHFGLYAYFRYALEAIAAHKTIIDGTRQKAFEIIAFSNASKDKAAPRIKSSRLGHLFTALYAQPSARVSYKQDPKYVEEGEEEKPIHKEYREVVEKIRKLEEARLEEDTGSILHRIGTLKTDFPVYTLKDLKKPFIRLGDLWGISKKRIKEETVVIGDSESDILLGVNNECAVIHGLWGFPSEEDSRILRRYNAESERRNIPDLKEIARLKKKAQSGKYEIYEAQSPVQLYDLFGLKRPPYLDVIPLAQAFNRIVNVAFQRQFMGQLLKSAKGTKAYKEAKTQKEYERLYDQLLRENAGLLREILLAKK